MELSLSLRLATECTLSEHISQSGRKNEQKYWPGVQVELTRTLLPRARFPIGGKHPAVSVHCADAVETEVTTTTSAKSTIVLSLKGRRGGAVVVVVVVVVQLQRLLWWQ